MKKTNELLKNSVMPKDTIVLAIMTKNGVQVFDSPKLASEVACPNCGCKDGILNVSGRIWYCSDVCWKMKRDKKAFSISSTLQFGVPELYKDASVETCKQPKQLLDFLESFGKKPYGFLTFFGNMGSGKTFASCALLESYRANGGLTGRFLNLADLYANWKEAVAGNVSERTVVAPFADSELLILDDFGTRAPSEPFLDLLYLMIEKRSLSPRVGTVITTNLSNEELKKVYGARILSRIGAGIPIKFTGNDRRKNITAFDRV
jgi:DNA replication protein DnaC